MHTLHGCMGDSEHSARILLTPIFPKILYFPLYFVLRDGEPIAHKIWKASSSPYPRVAGTYVCTTFLRKRYNTNDLVSTNGLIQEVVFAALCFALRSCLYESSSTCGGVIVRHWEE
jgi:hypothetical protein